MSRSNAVEKYTIVYNIAYSLAINGNNHLLFFKACPLPDVLQYSLCEDETKKALFAAQGAADWQTFLLHRSRELVSGQNEFAIYQPCKIVECIYSSMP